MTTDVHEHLLTPGEIARMFRVDPKTVTRWAASGRIGSIRTPGAPQVPRARSQRSPGRSLRRRVTVDRLSEGSTC